jgi:hypothetical protein
VTQTDIWDCKVSFDPEEGGYYYVDSGTKERVFTQTPSLDTMMLNYFTMGPHAKAQMMTEQTRSSSKMATDLRIVKNSFICQYLETMVNLSGYLDCCEKVSD